MDVKNSDEEFKPIPAGTIPTGTPDDLPIEEPKEESTESEDVEESIASDATDKVE